MSSLLNKPIYITNTKTRTKELFQPLEAGKVKMYSCGPTVYSHIHIGNLRAGLTSDLFFRLFKRFGYEVNYVRNYTDIDDRIINVVLQEKTTFEAVTQKYTQSVERDYAMAGMLEPTRKVKVTDHLPEIITMVETIIKNGKAYETDDHEVFYSIEKFPTYGQLSGKPLEDLMAGARVEINPKKKNPMDFSLWKPAKPNELTQPGLAWKSPWGLGRPGWHIECSAMAYKWLGAKMDLHHGGEDLIFPHHENEIAQTEAATNQSPYVKIWAHNAHLTFSKEKMSKSLGNVVNATDFLASYGGEVARFAFLGVHYRSTFDFSHETVDNAVQSLERIYEAKKKAEEIRAKKISVPDAMAEQGWGGFMIDCDRARNAILDHYANDLNTPGALSEIFTLIREWNRVLTSTPNAANTPAAILAANEFIKVLEEEIGSVIGIGKLSSESALAKFQEIKQLRQKNEGKTVISDDEISKLLQERKDVRVQKNFKRSDEIRDFLAANGIEIKDSPQGTTWARK